MDKASLLKNGAKKGDSTFPLVIKAKAIRKGQQDLISAR